VGAAELRKEPQGASGKPGGRDGGSESTTEAEAETDIETWSQLPWAI